MKDIIGTYYTISDTGDVYSKKSHKILKSQKNRQGYLTVSLIINGKLRTKSIHRLVAICYIDNPKEKEQVNHIDGNKLNNKVENLEWCTKSENIKHAYDLGLIDKIEKGKHFTGRFLGEHYRSRGVKQFNKDGSFIKQWSCATEARKILGINNSNITQCCKGGLKTVGGFIWKYV